MFMKIKIKFIGNIRRIFHEEEREIEVMGGANVQDVLSLLCETHGCRQSIFNQSNAIRPHVIVFKNQRHVDLSNHSETSLKEGDTIEISSLVAGG